MNNSEKLEKALLFATQKHKGQFRRGGEEYITHPVAVFHMLKERGYDEEYLLAALFHDLLEDTDATEEDILRIAGMEVLEAVKLLTKKEGYVMEEYVNAIKENDIAFRVKAYDRLHNLLSAVVSTEEFRRKYIKESILWYWDFCDEIPDAVRKLNETLIEPMDINKLKSSL